MTRNILILAMLFFSFTAYSAPDWDNASYGDIGGAQTDGKTLADTVKGYNSSGSLQDRLQSPIMGAGEMTTLGSSYQCNGKGIYEDLNTCNSNCATECTLVKFDAAIECNHSIEALVIKPYAIFAGGEVALQVSYDSNLDGVLDRSIETPNISGFCINGVMSCTAGTLNNCGFYEFTVPYKCSAKEEIYANINDCLDNCASGSCVAQTNHVGLVKSKQERVGRCDCTNSSCGKSFNSTFDSSMAVFGAGIVNHMVNSLGLQMSKSSLDSSSLSLSYMAMVSGGCSEENIDIAKLKEGKSTGTPDYTAVLLEAVNDPDSIYNLVTADTSVTEGQCEIINSVVFDNSRLSAFKSSDTCQLKADCRIDNEYACEPVCPPNSVYVSGLNKCELYNYPAGYFICPTGFQFGRFNAEMRGFEALPSADSATVCFKQVSGPNWTVRNRVYMCAWYYYEDGYGYSHCRNALSASNRLSLNIPKGAIDPEIWPTAMIYSYAYNGAAYTNLRLYPDGAQIANWNEGNYERSFTSVNGQVIATDIYVERTDYRNAMVYQTIPHSHPTKDGLSIIYHQNMTDWLGYDNIGTTTYLAVTVTLRQKQCPDGWYLQNSKCYQSIKPLSTLKCNEVRSELTEEQHCAYAANSTAVVCGDGFKHYAGGSSTNAVNGRFVTKKRYTCVDIRNEHDYSAVAEARQNTKLTESGDSYILSYKDETGATHIIDLDGQYSENGCQKSCRVTAINITPSTQVTNEGKPVTSSDNFAARLCIDNACPHDPASEKITQGCTCTQTDDFGKVVSILGVLEESTKDKICVQ